MTSPRWQLPYWIVWHAARRSPNTPIDMDRSTLQGCAGMLMGEPDNPG
jgi:hypothetical protein